MIRLNRIFVSGYKNIEMADLSISDFNIVVGANNTGKSNLLQVLSLLNFITNGGAFVQEIFNNGFRYSEFNEIVSVNEFRKNNTGNININLHFENSDSNLVFEYYINLKWIRNDNNIRYLVQEEKLNFKQSNQTGRPIRIFERVLSNVNDETTKIKWGTDIGSKKNIESIPVNASVIPFCELLLNSNIENKGYSDAIKSLRTILKAPIVFISNHAIKQNDGKSSDHYGRHVSMNIDYEVFRILDDNNKNFIFEKAIKEILNITEIDKIDFSSGKDERIRLVLFKHEGHYKRFSEFSDGTMSIMAIICKVLTTDSNLIMIEEPENSTHPKALLDLIEFIKSFRAEKQFIITTHSIALLNNSSIEEIIIGTLNERGLSQFCNVSDKHDILSKLQNKYSNFSDNIFFYSDDEEEDEILNELDDEDNLEG